MTSSKRKTTRSIPEEAFDKAVGILDGAVNRRVEKVMKSRLVLAPMALSLTVSCRLYLAVRDRRLSALLGRR